MISFNKYIFFSFTFIQFFSIAINKYAIYIIKLIVFIPSELNSQNEILKGLKNPAKFLYKHFEFFNRYKIH